MKEKIGEYNVVKLAGEGSFGKVYECLDKDSKKFAIKEIDKTKLNEELLDKLKNEAKISMDMSHPNIVKCFNTMQSNKKFYLVFEYCTGGDVMKYLMEKNTLDLKEALFIMKQMRDAYKYLLSKNIIHRDIKLENLLIGSADKMDIKLTDFGCSKIDPIGSTYCGTPKYMSLEIMDEKKTYNYKADLWAIGLCYWELIYGANQFPFSTKSMDVLKAEIKKFSGDNLRFPAKPKLPESFYNFFKGILNVSPELRMDADQFLHHPIFDYDPDNPSSGVGASSGSASGADKSKGSGAPGDKFIGHTFSGENLPKVVEAAVKAYNERLLEVKLTYGTAIALKEYLAELKDKQFSSYYAALCLILINKVLIKAEHSVKSLTEKKNLMKIDGFDELIKYPNVFNKFKEDFNEINDKATALDREIYANLLNNCFSPEYMQEIKANLYHKTTTDLQKFYKDTFGYVQKNYKTFFDQNGKNDVEKQLKKVFVILKGKITESLDVFY